MADGDHATFPDESAGTIRYLQARDFDGFVETDPAIHVTEQYFERNRRSEIGPNTILFSIMGTVGRVGLTGDDFPLSMANRAVGIVRPNPGISAKVLFAVLASRLTSSIVLGYSSGGIQTRLNLNLLRTLPIPEISAELTIAIEQVVSVAFSRQDSAIKLSLEAEHTLLSALGLADWSPPEPLSYSAKFSALSASTRLDSQFFAPRIQQLLDLLSKGGSKVGAVAKVRRERFDSRQCESFHYIEIGDVQSSGAAESLSLPSADAPSRATWHVRSGDIVTSMVRPIRRLSAQISNEQDGRVCSSGFVVLQPINIQPEVLLTFLRLPAICGLMDLYASASMYPAISEANILALPFPAIEKSTSDSICTNVQQSREARQRARDLLNRAKRAVEIAIEQNEAAALAYLSAP